MTPVSTWTPAQDPAETSRTDGAGGDGGLGRGRREGGMEVPEEEGEEERKEEEEEEEIRKCEGSAPLLVLDPPDGLNLGSLGVGAKLTVTLVLSSATVALHDVLVAAVSRVLVAHKAAGKHTKML